MILGIDEVGRGAWAGPMVVGAVVLGDAKIDGLTDSKKLTKKARERLSLEIRQKAAGVGLGWVSSKVIDEIGLSEALKLATRRAVAGVKGEYDEIIIDGTIRLIDAPNVTLLKKADLLIPAVSAASIVAKVARDAYMTYLDQLFDGYSFASHVGYGTAKHERAITQHGVLPIHRQSFAPIGKIIGSKSGVKSRENLLQSVGGEAEEVAAHYLKKQGHTIIERNWKTRTCEIDIISEHKRTLYFTEVKYRRQKNQGGGLAAVTLKKVKQMHYGSEVYVKFNDLYHYNRMLSAISLTGEPPTVENYIESVE